jgi:uncharacterized protein YegP (UPF0339 family)
MAHRWTIKKNRAGEYVAYFMYDNEVIWWTEGYSSKASAKNAIESVKKNAPGAEAVDETDSASDDPLNIFRDIQIPAADRLVSPNHNSKEFKNFEVAQEKLADKLRRSNDLRDFESEELAVALHEVSAIGDEARKSSLRVERLWNMAKNTLFWIFEKTVDGVIKALAVGALIALAALLGIPLPIG